MAGENGFPKVYQNPIIGANPFVARRLRRRPPSLFRSMPTFVKVILGFFLFLALLVAAPFLLESGIRAYDLSHGALTRPGALVSGEATAREGINRRLFREVRFHATGLAVRLEAPGLSAEEADRFSKNLHGTIRLLKLESQDDARPGLAPPRSAKEIVRFGFRLDPETRSATAGTAGWRLAPLAEEDVAPAATFADRLYELGDAYEIDVTFDGPVPLRNTLSFSYSKAPRSLLRGTWLEPIHEEHVRR